MIMSRPVFAAAALAGIGLLSACAGDATPRAEAATPGPVVPSTMVLDSTVRDVAPFPGTALPLREATLSTKLMATVDAVLAIEGARVTTGATLVRLDARDLVAKQTQATAGQQTADAARREAMQHATRMRSLFADSAATQAQLDAAEAGLARANAAVAQASGANAELQAIAEYAIVRAPFAGTITRRHVDPGAFAAPGMPLVSLVDDATLRVRVEVPLDAATTLRRGQTLVVHLADTTVQGSLEGIAPAAGNLYVVNVLVPNAARRFLPGTPAVLEVPRGTRTARLVPTSALVRDGDLVGVDLVATAGTTRRWVRVGATYGTRTEILAGLDAGDRVVTSATGAR